MANISSSIENWSTTAASNQPDGADTFSIVDDLRAIQAGVRREFASTTIASAGTVNIGAAAASYLAVSGNTTVTAFDTIASGIERTLKFDGALTLTHNGTTLILPGAANITTAAGDVAVFRSEGSGNWRCISYQKASGHPVTGDIRNKNKIIGGDFTVNPWVRGTSFAAIATGSYSADRWLWGNTSAGVVTIAKTADAPTAAQAGMYNAHCLHVDVTTADAAVAAGDLAYVLPICWAAVATGCVPRSVL